MYPEQSVTHNPSRCWNWFYERNQFRERGEPAEILALVADVMARHPIDRDRVYVAGLSAGGAMAAILAEQAPDVFAAVGIMAGVPLHASHDVASARAAMHGDLSRAHLAPASANVVSRAFARMRATVWSGAHDRTVDPANAGELARQFRQLLGVPETDGVRSARAGATVERWSDASGVVRVETWSVAAMGHAWSGGSFRGSHTYPAGPRASDEMLSFFLGDRSVPA